MLSYYCLSSHNYRTTVRNVLHLILCTHEHIRSRTVTPYQRSRGGCELFDRNRKCVGAVPIHFQLELNTQGGLIVFTDKNVWEWSQANVGAIPRKLFADIYWYGILFSFQCRAFVFWILFKQFSDGLEHCPLGSILEITKRTHSVAYRWSSRKTYGLRIRRVYHLVSQFVWKG